VPKINKFFGSKAGISGETLLNNIEVPTPLPPIKFSLYEVSGAVEILFADKSICNIFPVYPFIFFFSFQNK